MSSQIDKNDLAKLSKHDVVAWEPGVIARNRIHPNVTRCLRRDGNWVSIFHVKPVYYETHEGYWRPLSEITTHHGNRFIVLKPDWDKKMSIRYLNWLMKRCQLVKGQLSIESPFLIPLTEQTIHFTTSTFFPDPDPETTTVDGRIYTDGKASWTLARDAANGDVAEPSNTADSISTNNFAGTYGVQVGFYLFDTASLPDTDTISSATLNINRDGSTVTNADTTSYVAVETNPASNTDLVVGDFDSRVFTDLGNLALSSVGAGYNVITLNATGLTKISKTGVTKLGMTTLLDVNNSAPTGLNGTGASMLFAENAGTSTDHYLEVIHVAGVSSVGVHPTLLTLGVG